MGMTNIMILLVWSAVGLLVLLVLVEVVGPLGQLAVAHVQNGDHDGDQEQAHAGPADSVLPELQLGNLGQVQAQPVEVDDLQLVRGGAHRVLDGGQHVGVAVHQTGDLHLLVGGVAAEGVGAQSLHRVNGGGDLLLGETHHVQHGPADDVVQCHQDGQGQEGPEAAAHGVDALPLVQLLDLLVVLRLVVAVLLWSRAISPCMVFICIMPFLPL